MEKLHKGIYKFYEDYYKKKKKLFEKLAKKQEPTVFFITCSDSRVDPNLITNSQPGELFVLRNVGNIIPPFDAQNDKNSAASAIEFAIEFLQIRDIIICGHSNCGAMKAIYEKEPFFEKTPHLKNWLKFAEPIKDIFENSNTNDLQKRTEQQNIILQLKNLITYPVVAPLFQKGEIRLYGWYYEIDTGKVYELDKGTGEFKPIESI